MKEANLHYRISNITIVFLLTKSVDNYHQLFILFKQKPFLNKIILFEYDNLLAEIYFILKVKFGFKYQLIL